MKNFGNGLLSLAFAFSAFAQHFEQDWNDFKIAHELSKNSKASYAG